mgnify:CR=1 FL=1
MQAWKLRFRRFEAFYQKGELEESLVDKILESDGNEVLINWVKYVQEKYGKIPQPKLEEDFA